MKTSRLLALAVFLVVIAVLLLVRGLGTRTRTEEPLPASAHPVSTTGGTELAGDAALEETRGPAAEAPTPNRSPSPAAGSAKLRPSLRIHVRYSTAEEDEPNGLAVGVANVGGEILQPRHVGANEYLLVEEPPGTYVVVVKAPGYRTMTAQAQLAASVAESSVTLTVRPERQLVVRWRADDGRPIAEALTELPDAEDHVELAIVLTKFRWREEFLPPTSARLAFVQKNLLISADGPNGAGAYEVKFDEPPIAHDGSDVFTRLAIEEDGPLWISAFSRGERVDLLPIGVDDTEVSVVTALSELSRQGCSLKVVIVDDLTGAPIESAWCSIDGDEAGDTTSDAQGRLVLEHLRPGPARVTFFAERNTFQNVWCVLRTGETIDLGTVRLNQQFAALYFRIVDQNGALAVGVPFELVELEGEQGCLVHDIAMSVRSDVIKDPAAPERAPNLEFFPLTPGRYLLRCRNYVVDAAPRIVTAQDFVPYRNPRGVPVIVVRGTYSVDIVLDPPIAKSTRAVIESEEGLVLRDLELDEFGVASAYLLPGTYRLHLVEYGQPSADVEMRVDRDPFVFAIHR